MYTAGIDIGGTNTRIAIVNEAYEIMQRVQFSTDTDNPNATLKKIQEVVQGFGIHVDGVGLSCPGPLDLKHGVILDTPNLKGKWHGCLGYLFIWKMMQIWLALLRRFWDRGRTVPMCSF